MFKKNKKTKKSIKEKSTQKNCFDVSLNIRKTTKKICVHQFKNICICIKKIIHNNILLYT